MGQKPRITKQIEEEIATYRRLCTSLELKLQYEPSKEGLAELKVYRTILEVLEFWQAQGLVDISLLVDTLAGNLSLEISKLLDDSHS